MPVQPVPRADAVGGAEPFEVGRQLDAQLDATEDAGCGAGNQRQVC